MPRGTREKSKTGIYHVMLRGINGQRIFEDAEDNEKFLQVLQNCQAISEFQVYAYCLMGNHVHLLLREGKEGLQQIFRRIGARYVYWYNRKYKRCGHLFQDRFKSEAIEDDTYFLAVLRYIHQNPLRAKLCQNIDEYPWSSYNEYVRTIKNIDIDYALSLFNDDERQARAEFIQFHGAMAMEKCLEMPDVKKSFTDEEAKKVMKRISGATDAGMVQQMKVVKRDKTIRKMHEMGVSIRQIARLTGIGKGVIERVLQDA